MCVCVCISRERWVLRLHLLFSKWWSILWPGGRIRLFANYHYADLSEGIELLKCLSDMFCLECVSQINSVLSSIFHAIYGAVCIQLTHSSYDDCENTCTWSYYSIIIKSEVWPIYHCLGLAHETMVSTLCLSIFLWINFNPSMDK